MLFIRIRSSHLCDSSESEAAPFADAVCVWDIEVIAALGFLMD